jgi:CheY-like chemotaxis protein
MFVARHILVADDSETDFLLLQRAFHLSGFSHRLTHVRNGLHAVNYMKGDPPFQNRATSPPPDLLIIDDNMPEMSGMDILKFLREQSLPVPAIMLSGSGKMRDIQAALALGAAEYLEKPTSHPDLVVLAQTIHHRWLAAA